MESSPATAEYNKIEIDPIFLFIFQRPEIAVLDIHMCSYNRLIRDLEKMINLDNSLLFYNCMRRKEYLLCEYVKYSFR